MLITKFEYNDFYNEIEVVENDNPLMTEAVMTAIKEELDTINIGGNKVEVLIECETGFLFIYTISICVHTMTEDLDSDIEFHEFGMTLFNGDVVFYPKSEEVV